MALKTPPQGRLLNKLKKGNEDPGDQQCV